LPHWQIGESWYFITFRTKSGLKLSGGAKDAVLNSINHDNGKRYQLSIAVVMPDHSHLILKPLKSDGDKYNSLGKILWLIKGASVRKIGMLEGREGALWQDESFDRIIRDEKEWQSKHEYIRDNPFKAGLAERAEDYPWLIELHDSERY